MKSDYLSQNAGNIAWVAYKLPYSSKWVLQLSFLQSNTDFFTQNEPAIGQRGFQISPFNKKTAQVLFLPAHFSFTLSKNNELLGPAEEYSHLLEPELYETALKFKDYFCMERILGNPEISFNFSAKINNQNDKLNYTNLVSKAVEAIKGGKYRKLVPARKEIYSVNKDFSLPATFFALMDRYPNAFVYAFSVPGVASWTGASPETLLKFENETIETMALASTRRKEENQDLAEIIWNRKDYQEQELVGEYIRETFLASNLPNFSETEVKPILAGHLVHLVSHFKGKASREQAFRFVESLHPTPAVCGNPKEEAQQFLAEHEYLDRIYYSGYLGPVETNSFHFFVNLRCMQVLPGELVLYAGAGLTADSVPEKEYDETVLKMATVLSALTQQPVADRK